MLLPLFFSSIVFANNYTTPGTGVRWNMDDLVTNSGGDVTFSAGVYHINDTIFIRLTDTLSITSDAIVDFAASTYLDVNGTLIVNPPAGVRFTAQNIAAGFLGVRIDSSNATVLRKLTLEYAVSLRLGDSRIIIDSCIFRYNSPVNNFGNAAVTLFRSSPVITNSQFLDNQRAAIQGGANIPNAPKITGCLFSGNNTLNTNVPQINLGATGDGSDTVLIMNNQLLRASTNSGGIGFLPIGNVFAVIKGNVIKNNRYGLTLNGGANINALISYNQIDSNNTQGNPILGGSGISFAGGTEANQQNSIVTGNLIRWNLWGVTIQNRSRPNLGNITNTDTSDDGKNQFIGNTNNSTPGIDLYNNSPDSIYAQNNYWGSDNAGEVESKIFHQPDNNFLGPVNYTNFILPVVLVRFTAVETNNKVLLSWQTVSETNSQKFIVEKSIDGRLFYAVATIAASGNASSVKTYGFQDNIMSSYTSMYYRLQIVDLDGRFTYSDIATVVSAIPAQKYSVKMFPNVITGSQLLQVQVASGTKQTVSIRFCGADGKEIARTSRALSVGTNQFSIIPDAPLPPGWIYITFAGNNIYETIPVLNRR